MAESSKTRPCRDARKSQGTAPHQASAPAESERCGVSTPAHFSLQRSQGPELSHQLTRETWPAVPCFPLWASSQLWVAAGMGGQQVGALMGSPVPWRPGPAMAAASSPLSHCGHWPSMQAFLEATAETRAAPRPLPSSDWMKVISQLGVSLRTMAWNRSLKLRREAGLQSLLHGSHGPPPPTLQRRDPPNAAQGRQGAFPCIRA